MVKQRFRITLQTGSIGFQHFDGMIEHIPDKLRHHLCLLLLTKGKPMHTEVANVEKEDGFAFQCHSLINRLTTGVFASSAL